MQKTNQTIDEIIGSLNKKDEPSEETAEKLNAEIREIFDESVDSFTANRQSTRAKLEELARGKAAELEWKYDQMEMNDQKVQTLQQQMKTLAKLLENKKVPLSDKEREAVINFH